MPIVLPIVGFIFYRVVFKMAFNENIPHFANLIICLGLLASGFVLNMVQANRFGAEASAKRIGKDKPSLKTVSPIFALGVLCLLITGFSWLISYGFSERFFDRTWDRAHGFEENFTIAFIFCVPLIAHYLINFSAFKIKLKQIDPA